LGSGIFAVYTGLIARSEALDSASSNLANVNTNGFRAERDYFREMVLGPEAQDSQLDATINNFGILGGNAINLNEGAIAATGNPLDLAIEGAGFFAVQVAPGPDGVRYTRDGAFQRSRTGTLITARGEPVLNIQGQPIVVPTGEVSIGADGAVSVEGATVGTIGVFTFPPNVPLVPEGINRYQANPKQAVVSKAATIRQGSLEGSNQDAIQGSLQLILVQRQAELMQKALSVFYSDFDKTATEELPKV
jgi:flagellar basal-body rod protein FlgF